MPTSRRRVLTWATSKEQAKKRRDAYRKTDPDAEAEQVDGRWAVTAPKTTKGT